MLSVTQISLQTGAVPARRTGLLRWYRLPVSGWAIFRKLFKYNSAGVREYWIVDPENKFVQSFWLEDGRYAVKEFGAAGDKMRVNVLEDCVIDLSEVFPEE